jgi:hypothetical protein
MEGDLGNAVFMPLLEHPDTEMVDMLLYHTSMGRILTQNIQELCDNIRWCLNLFFVFFVNDFVRFKIQQMQVPDTAYVAAITVTFLLVVMWSQFSGQVKQYVGHKLGTPGVYDMSEEQKIMTALKASEMKST